MSGPSAPVLTVRSGKSQGSFAAGRDVIVGSDLRADLRVAHPLVGRAHLLLRFDQGRWIAVDNDSPNGIFVNGQRAPMVDIHDGQTINLGRPDGPRITFEVGHHRGIVGLLPPTETFPAITLPPGTASGGPQPSGTQPTHPPTSPGSGPHRQPPRQPPPPRPPSVAQLPSYSPADAEWTVEVPTIPPGAAQSGRHPATGR